MGPNKRLALGFTAVYAGLMAYVWYQAPSEARPGFFTGAAFGPILTGYCILLGLVLLMGKIGRWIFAPPKPKPPPKPKQKGPYLKPRAPL